MKRFIALAASSALALGVLLPLGLAPAQATSVNHVVRFDCTKDVSLYGLPGDTYTFIMSGNCLSLELPNQGDFDYVDYMNIQNADATGTMDCVTQFKTPGFLSKPTSIEIEGSSSSDADQTATLSDNYCYDDDWYFYTNKETVQDGTKKVTASGMTLLASSSAYTGVNAASPLSARSLTIGDVVATIGDNGPTAYSIIYRGPVPARPSAPRLVKGTAGLGEVTVSWTEPSDPGNATITKYAVKATPGGRRCTTTGALSCTVTGLRPGTAYTFKVWARNKKGLSPASEASAPVTPKAEVTLTITGTRDGKVARISGSTTGLKAGAKVTAWFKTASGAEFVAGDKVPVGSSGRFTWTRSVTAGQSLWVYFASGDKHSNTVKVTP